MADGNVLSSKIEIGALVWDWIISGSLMSGPITVFEEDSGPVFEVVLFIDREDSIVELNGVSVGD